MWHLDLPAAAAQVCAEIIAEIIAEIASPRSRVSPSPRRIPPQKLPKHASSLLPRDLVREIASLGEDYDLGAAEAFAGRAAAKLDVNGASAEVRHLHLHLRLLPRLYPCF